MSHHCWRIRVVINAFLCNLENTKLYEDIEYLLPVKFHPIPFSSFRGEVENVLANKRSGRQSWCSDRPEKHKLGRECWDQRAFFQVSLNSVQKFKRNWKMSPQIRGQGGHLGFPIGQKKAQVYMLFVEITQFLWNQSTCRNYLSFAAYHYSTWCRVEKKGCYKEQNWIWENTSI